MKKSSAFLIVILLLCGPTPLSAQTKTIDHGNLSICPGGSVLLEVKNSPENATFQWLKDGNEISGATSNSYSAMQAGSYSVKVTDASLITELYDPVTVVINPSPIAGFTFVTNNQCSSTPIQFTNTSSGNSLTYSWDFSDPTSPNNTSTQQSPSHIFIGSFGSANQSFPVKLTVTSSAGCSTSYTSTITTKQLGDAKLAGQSPITYNGLTYFRACGSGATQMTFVNQSSTSSTNSSYSIDWGDGTTPFSDASLNSTTHTYQVGTWKLTYTVISNNGCSNTAVYYVFVGSNPAVGLGNPGNTVICTGTSLRFPITGTENNPPGTIYTVTFNDGTAPVVYTTAPPYIDHEFQSTSCGKTSGSYSNSFSATIVATNPCSNSSAIVSPIYVSERPKANFTQSKEIVCTSQVVTLANTSQGNDVSDAGCVEGNFVWSISPATGWTKNGDLGNDYGQAIPSLWLNGSKNLSLTFNTPGTYSVSIKNGNSICGSDIITKTICVNASPTAAFSVDNESGCGPLVVKTNNTSSTPTCGSNTFQWSVSPSTGVSYINTTSSSSQNPQFNFSGAGTYTISLTTTSPGSCNSTTSKTITVKAKPSVTLNGIPANLCQGSSITPGATVSSSTPVTYMWTFDGATPANSTTLPAGSITFTGTGNRQITLAATNECGTTSQLSSVLVGATPSITSTNSVSICNNGTVNLALTSNVASTFTWQATSNSNVNGESTSIQTSSTLSNTLANTATTPQTVVYTIIPKATSSGCTGIAQTVNVIVYPTLAPPTVTTPVNYCEGETTTALLATPATGNTLLWYSQGMGGVGSSTTPTVSTASTAPVTYYVSQQSSPANCESGRASITVNVTPKIINNSIGSDQTICSGTPATTIIQSGIAPSGGAGVNTYSYKWESSVDGGNTWNVIAGQIGSSYSPGSPAVKTMYHRIISSGNCSVKSNDVTITVLGSLSHFDIAASQTICAGNTSATLDGQTPNGGNSSFTYLWQSSPDGNTWSDITAATGEDYSPAALNSTTYYKRKTTSGQCSAFSSIIIITVNQKPAATIATNATQICSYNTGTIDFTVSAGKAPFTFALTVTLPDNSISTLTHAANNNSSSLQVLPANSATGKYSYVLTSIKDANGCELSGSTSTADITVKEKPTLTLSSSIAVCSGAGTPLTASGAASYIWTPATGLSTATGSNITATPTATTTYTVTGTTDGCTSSGTITVTVHPKPTPPVTTSNLSYCINATAYPLTATAATGHTLSWYTGTATTGSNTAPTPVTNATATLNYSVSQSNSFLCESDKLPVTVTVYGAITGNTIEQDQTICSGTTAAQIGQQGAPVAGGSGAYTYQWQSSINNGTSWNAMPGQTEASLQPGSPATTTLYQRIISSTSCTSTSNNVTVIVLNQLSHFDISASQIICAGGTPVMLDGQLPIGGTSNFTYLWQSSANGSTWADMTTATGKDYNPGALTVTTYYRRKTTSGQCSALSGPVIITVNPTPVVTITTSTTEICSYNTGAIDFTVSTGKAPYTFAIIVTLSDNTSSQLMHAATNNNSSLQVLPVNSAAGKYSYLLTSIKDANGCELSGNLSTAEITVKEKPTLALSNSTTVCAGSGTMLTAGGATSYSWTPATGLSATTGSNVTATPVTTTTYTVTGTTNNCNSSGNVTVTVHPTPAPPVTTSNLHYCLNATANPLTATAVSGNALNWYTGAVTPGTSTPPTPATSAAATLTYSVSQTNIFLCESDKAPVTVIVYPAIAGNDIGEDQTICENNTAAHLQSKSNISGGDGAYRFQWESSADELSWSAITNATQESYAPGSLTASVYYRRTINSLYCSSTSNTVHITVQGKLSNNTIAAAQTICAGTTPALLNGSLPAGGNYQYQYQWESSIDNTNWQVINSSDHQDYQPQALNASAYYRRKVISGACNTSSAVIAISVNPIPVMNPPGDIISCNNSGINSTPFTANTTSNTSFNWTNDNTAIGLSASGSGNSLPAFTSSNATKAPATGVISVIPVYSNGGTSCIGTAVDFNITILPVITIAAISDTVVCNQVTLPARIPVSDAATYPGATVSYGWEVTGQGITLSKGNGAAVPAFNSINNTSNDLVATVRITPAYSFNGKTCEGTPFSYHITVKPGTPAADAGPDQTLCASGNYTMQASLPSGYTGLWQQASGDLITIASRTSPGTLISGMQAGKSYSFTWTITGLPACPSTTATVKILNYLPLQNTIPSEDLILCSGQTVNIAATAATGGSGSFIYQWQQSTDNSTWKDIAGQTNAALYVLPGNTVYVRRNVKAGSCETNSNVVLITVQPPITNNNISGEQRICYNTMATVLTGSVPQGGDGNFTYQWEQSADGINWTVIAGEAAKDYAPGQLVQTTSYRRAVTTTLCSGQQGNNSPVIKVTVNPDAIAAYYYTKQLACAPFSLTPAVIQPTVNPARNKTYEWYANDLLIGTGTSFPGYIIPTAGDSVTIKMKAISLYDCKHDSVSYTFYTIANPKPAFTMSSNGGCGPLTVIFSNTTPGLQQFSYAWDFGNGITSNSAAPAQVVFQPNPNFGDTTYKITLYASTVCETIAFTQQVIVKAPPKALFTPAQPFGCSPFTNSFVNASQGKNLSFVWDFDDGTIVLVNDKATQQHLFTTGVQDTFQVKLKAINECGTNLQTYAIVVSPNTIKLNLGINGNERTGCQPHAVQFINNTSGATGFRWDFGDGGLINTTKNIDTVTHIFQQPGKFIVTLLATNGCTDTSTTRTIEVFARPQANFSMQPNPACIGSDISFTNQTGNANGIAWRFGDGFTSSLQNPVHRYNEAGSYSVTLIATLQYSAGNTCVDSITKPLVVGPSGRFSYVHGFVCGDTPVRFEVSSSDADQVKWEFGDGKSETTTARVIYHSYSHSGSYLPKATLIKGATCSFSLQPKDTIKVDYVNAGFLTRQQRVCGSTSVRFTDTSRAATGIQDWQWHLGNATTSTTQHPSATYQFTNSYPVTLTVTAASGCTASTQMALAVKVNNRPVAAIEAGSRGCQFQPVTYKAVVNSTDPITSYQWIFSDQGTARGMQVQYGFKATGQYTATLISGTGYECYDTVSQSITIYTTPIVKANNDQLICKGKAYPLNATGAVSYQWTPQDGSLSCDNCQNPLAHPGTTTQYIVQGSNTEGCSNQDTVVITVAQPVHIQASNNDTICIGQKVSLSVTGATSYQWSPALSLDAPTGVNPVATPASTTRYQVIGFDAHQCFQDTAYVIVAVGQYPRLTLLPDTLLSTGTLFPLTSTATNGPIRQWRWQPATDLSCSNCALPIATIKNNVCYTGIATTMYGCSHTDTVCIKVFCEGTQVYIPNLFTPDNDGHNDKLVVRGKGIVQVKSFRIFNRWGQVVFERSNFPPNDTSFGWDGMVKGVAASPDVYVYTCDVVCENGIPYTYKGNVAIIK